MTWLHVEELNKAARLFKYLFPYASILQKHNPDSRTTAHLRTVVDLRSASWRRHQRDDITVNGFIWRWSEGVRYHPQETREALLHLLSGLWGTFDLTHTGLERSLVRCRESGRRTPHDVRQLKLEGETLIVTASLFLTAVAVATMEQAVSCCTTVENSAKSRLRNSKASDDCKNKIN